MKKYTKPLMEIEEFVPNSYIAACGDTGVACINMNNARYVYYDSDNDGDLDDKYTGWNYQNDCHKSGDSSAKKHTINSIDGYTKVKVELSNGTTIDAIIDPAKVDEHTPHFISIKSINAST